MDTTGNARRKRVGAHPAQLRAQVLAECSQPGASVARVALGHGLNANLVHKWRRDQRAGDAGAVVESGGGEAFIALPMPVSTQATSSGNADIRLELRKGASTISVSWPVQEAAQCAAWLAQWLR